MFGVNVIVILTIFITMYTMVMPLNPIIRSLGSNCPYITMSRSLFSVSPFSTPPSPHPSPSTYVPLTPSVLPSIKSRLQTDDELVALPTETVYGLACNALSQRGAERVFIMKQRPLTDPLIVHVLNEEEGRTLVSANDPSLELFSTLASEFWPGPLTMILPSSDAVPPIVTSNTSTVALRSPSNEQCRAVMEHCGFPLAMPSANVFGHISPTRKEHVMGEFPTGVWIVEGENDGGDEGRVGIESTVVKITEDYGTLLPKIQILRPGSVTPTDITECLESKDIEFEYLDPPVKKALGEDEVSNGAPGQSVKHYAPSVPAYVWTGRGGVSEVGKTVVVDYGSSRSWLIGECLAYRSLSEGGEPEEAGRRIYDVLRWAEGVGGAEYICLPDLRGVEDERIEGIRDRIWRSSSGVVQGD